MFEVLAGWGPYQHPVPFFCDPRKGAVPAIPFHSFAIPVPESQRNGILKHTSGFRLGCPVFIYAGSRVGTTVSVGTCLFFSSMDDARFITRRKKNEGLSEY